MRKVTARRRQRTSGSASTALYSSLTQFKNDGGAYAPRAASAIPAGLTSAGDRDLTEFVAGIRHSF